jgi:hypothetical protein
VFSFKNEEFKCFPATGKNDYLVLTDNHTLAFGGGDGRFALWINENLIEGYSQECATYCNDVLTNSEHFELDVVQVWGFVM